MPRFDDFDRSFDRMERNFWRAWWVMALISLAFLGLIAWVAIRLVQHFT